MQFLILSMRTPADYSRVTVHMVASLDGFVAREDGRVDWLETAGSEFAAGETLSPEEIEEFLQTIDCYVMGARTYETALGFEKPGFGWASGNEPVFVLTSRTLPRRDEAVEFFNGELAELIGKRLRPRFRHVWVAGGGVVAGECVRLGLADEIRYSIAPVAIGAGIPFFQKLAQDVPLQLTGVRAFRNGMVELCYCVLAPRG